LVNENKTPHHNVVFWISSITVIILVLFGVFLPKVFAKGANWAFNFTTYAFGWLFLISVFFFILFCIYLAFGKYGKIKLGSDDEKPEFSFFTWVGMLFSAGFGIGLVFWGIAEPMSHYFSPPTPDIMGQTPEAARTAMRFSFFHWGISQWSVFTIVGLAIGYFQFRKKGNSLISTTITPLFRNNIHSFWRHLIDILAVIATVMGVATSLGLGILQISGGMNLVFSIPATVYVQLIITVILLVLYLSSSTTGLNKGIKYLSNLNLSLALILMLFVFIFGPTVFILNSFVQGIGDYFQRFIDMSLRLRPYSGGKWIRDWTIFYWAWAIAWSPFVGGFIARVSRGRTIREFVIGVLLIPPLIALVWTAVFGGTALHIDLFQNGQIAEAVDRDVASALFTTYSYLPFPILSSILSIILIFTFLITSADSATFVLGMMTTNGSLNPPMLTKIIWGTLIAAIAAVLLISSGLEGLQTASLISALPFTLILIAMSFSLLASLKKEVFTKNPKRK